MNREQLLAQPITGAVAALNNTVGAISTMAQSAYPELTGSEKQIAWASEIRAEAIAAIAAIIEAEGDNDGDYVTPELAATITEARWWIDNREQTPVANPHRAHGLFSHWDRSYWDWSAVQKRGGYRS